MLRRATLSTRLELVVALLLFSICGYVVSPFSYGDRRVLVPQDPGLDAIQQTLLVGEGVDKLLSNPRSFYDTAILYPDHNQLRTTEPLLGFALLGLPLRAVLHANDADLFELLRWAIVVTCLVYAYLLFRTVGLDAVMAVAGAVLCLTQPSLLRGIERLQVVSVLLILPVLYHGLMAQTSRRFGHSLGLFVFSALYPLCGMINASLSAMAAVFALPLLVKILAADDWRRNVRVLVLPVVLAAVVDVLATAPWLFDRSDLAVYAGDEFLQIKHWNAVQAPVRAADLGGFLAGSIGPGVVAALAILCALALTRRVSKAAEDAVRRPEHPLPGHAYLVVVLVAAAGVALSSSMLPGGMVFPWLQLVFQISCYAALSLYWRDQILLPISSDQNGIRNDVVMLSGGLGAFLCLMSFGPVYVSNDSPLASHIMTMLLSLLPPLKFLREFDRIWIPGMLFLSVYIAIRLGMAVSRSAPIVRLGAPVVVAVAAMSSVYSRQVVPSVDIEAPRDFIDLASHSRGSGAIYVHPYMRWNTLSGVWMIPIARELGRPVVNGYLGILPPWFSYATSVLHRFPDNESLWLLRKWKVETVVSLAGDVAGADSTLVDKVFDNGNGAIYEVAASSEDVPHPSGDACQVSGRQVRIERRWSPPEPSGDGGSSTVTVPNGFSAMGVEIAFGQSVVGRIPASIGVYAFDSGGRVRLNQGDSGEWIESLAADALLRRRSPVATIRLKGPEQRELQVEFDKSAAPPIERIALCGEWTR